MKYATDDTFYYVKYVRVSADEQREGISIDFQSDKIDEWINRQSGKWVCIGEFQEDFTGFEYERPEGADIGAMPDSEATRYRCISGPRREIL